MSYKAVLFDLDGTLLNTLDDLADSMNEVLASHGWSGHPAESYRYFVGDGFENLVRRAIPISLRNDEMTVQRCLTAAKAVYERRWNTKTQLYSGVSDLLDRLVEKGIFLAILSNKPHKFVEKIVMHYLGNWRFDAVRGAMPEAPAKPDPTVAFEISRTLSIPTECFLYLGDTNTDMKTAIAARMFPVGALWGFRMEEELLEAGAHALVRHPLDVLQLLDRGREA
jgi:phosphoglycolate phosphatase